MSMLSNIAVFVLVLGGLVFFHELGHFLAAKFFKVKVLTFSLGFGPRVWSFKRGETEYQLAALPLGGFVRMAGSEPEEKLEGKDRGRGFLEQAPWKRTIISFAGPFVNLVLPVAVFAALNMSPREAAPPVVGVVLAGEPAERAGFQAGDRVLSVDGIPTRTFEEMREAVGARATKPIVVEVQRGSEKLALTVTPSSENEEETPVEVTRGRIGVIAGHLPPYVGVVPGSRSAQAGLQPFDRVVKVNESPVRTRAELDRALAQQGDGALSFTIVRGHTAEVPGASVSSAQTLELEVPGGEGPLGIDTPDLYVRDVSPDSPAWKAGLRPLDRIVALEGEAVSTGLRLERRLADRWRAKKKEMPLVVQRGDERVELSFTPQWKTVTHPYYGPTDQPELGFEFHPGVYRTEPFAPEEMVTVSDPPLAALTRAFHHTVETTRVMTLGIVGIFTGQVSTRSVASPIMMYQLVSVSTEQGLASILTLFALISVNLGLVNLLPIPALDGFQILVSGIEGISRRPVSVRFREVANLVGVICLIGLMVLALTNDIVRLVAF